MVGQADNHDLDFNMVARGDGIGVCRRAGVEARAKASEGRVGNRVQTGVRTRRMIEPTPSFNAPTSATMRDHILQP